MELRARRELPTAVSTGYADVGPALLERPCEQLAGMDEMVIASRRLAVHEAKLKLGHVGC